ncbi:MAG: T9SS C-terminal target domain-containing protein [Bacteroidia bacterium]
MKNIIFTLLLLLSGFTSFGQYASAAGKPGTTAINKDSSIFINWAKQCTILRGWKNIAQKDSGFTTIGDSASAIGKAGENGIVSLGDSGMAICQFPKPIKDGPGWDFAVFENSFDDRYLELAFVEVSSDGFRYFKFPNHSLTDTVKQTGPFGFTEPEKINNLAGKYRSGYGTPFDISDIPDYKDLDKNAIRFIKIVDVIGSLNPAFAAYDTAGRKINDPWPTVFSSGGFDLDAVGVIYEQPSVGIVNIHSSKFITGPNPIAEFQKLNLTMPNNLVSELKIYDMYGHFVNEIKLTDAEQTIEAKYLPRGLFFIHISNIQYYSIYKGIKL